MEAVFDIGACAMTTSSAERFGKEAQAQLARETRARKPEEIALREVIDAVRGKGPCPKPSKEAGYILVVVNERLRAKGLVDVSVDVIRRRLEKFPRS